MHVCSPSLLVLQWLAHCVLHDYPMVWLAQYHVTLLPSLLWQVVTGALWFLTWASCCIRSYALFIIDKTTVKDVNSQAVRYLGNPSLDIEDHNVVNVLLFYWSQANPMNEESSLAKLLLISFLLTEKLARTYLRMALD